jgi:O-antigen/teichoic acid export membrane protein
LSDSKSGEQGGPGFIGDEEPDAGEFGIGGEEPGQLQGHLSYATEVGGILEDGGVKEYGFAGYRIQEAVPRPRMFGSIAIGSLVTFETNKIGKSRVLLFSFSGGLANALNVILGPLILRKVGLAEYGQLSVALWVFSILATISEFGVQAHLLSLYSRGGEDGRRGIRDSLYLKAGLLLVSFCLYWAYRLWFPHPAPVKSLVGWYLIALAFSTLHLEWFFIANGRLRVLLGSRAAVSGAYACLVVAWYFSPYGLAALAVCAGLSQFAGSALFFANIRPLERVARLGMPSLGGMARTFARIVPLAATQILSPFFMGSGVFLMERFGFAKEMIGAYSIANRVAMGVLSFILPLIFYLIPQMKSRPGLMKSLPRILGLSALPMPVLAVAGPILIWGFYRFSDRGAEHFGYTVSAFLVLLIGLYLNLVRVPFVSQTVAGGRYRRYFLIHLAACMPVILLSAYPWLPATPAWIPWLVCLPEALATGCFLILSRTGAEEDLKEPPVFPA